MSLRADLFTASMNTVTHEVLRLALKADDSSYALDLTGAQYGWYEAVVPWSTYCSDRVAKINKTVPLRSVEQTFASYEGIFDYPRVNAMRQLEYRITKGFLNSMYSKVADFRLSPKTIGRMTERQLLDKQKGFLDDVTATTKAVVDRIDPTWPVLLAEAKAKASMRTSDESGPRPFSTGLSDKDQSLIRTLMRGMQM